MTSGGDRFTGRRVTVMGLGKFGGGLGAARFLAEHGARVTVTDTKTDHEMAESAAMLGGLGIRFVFGGHDMNDFTSADIVVVSPAVPRNSEYVHAARAARAELTTEIGLFVTLCPAPVCGITGSNGKTTTVSMIGAILDHDGQPFHVGGNIGGSLLSSLTVMTPDDRVVLELSSFQLEWLADMAWSPHIAAVLNITPNHLDRHRTFEEYRDAKSAILRFQKPCDTAVLVRDDSGSRSLGECVNGSLVWVGTNLDSGMEGLTLERGWIVRRAAGETMRIFDTGELVLPGAHNVTNAMTACACCLSMGADIASIRSGMGSFRGLPHRLEFVAENRGVKFFNDSKATTPESTVAAVNAFSGRVIPILGGYDKGVPFSGMAQSIGHRVSWAALIGQTAPAIEEALAAAGIGFTRYDTLEDAVAGSIARAQRGDVVMLSPGCASYDMFTDYEDRGERFKGIVKIQTQR